MLRYLLPVSVLFGGSLAKANYDQVLGFREKASIESRPLSEIHEAALAEGGTVTCWHGGDETNRQDHLKEAFEKRFPGMTLNVTVDLSKYMDARLDGQLADNKVHVDSVILQTLHDYPRWAQQGALLHYAPHGFDQVWPAFKDEAGAWYGVQVSSWAGSWNTEKLPDIDPPVEWTDWLRPEFQDRLILTYPNDDDAVLFAFYLIMRQYGTKWFDSLLALNPRWVRGTQTSRTIMAQKDSKWAATFTAAASWKLSSLIKVSRPHQGQFVSWPQTAAILKDAPHPEGAKLLHNFLLSTEWQSRGDKWPVRMDVEAAEGFPDIMQMNGTNPTEFFSFMADRALVERLRFYFEDRIGTPKGENPLRDGI